MMTNRIGGLVLFFLITNSFITSRAFAAEGSAPGSLKVIHLNDEDLPNRAVSDPYDSSRLHTLPKNLRRIDSFFFSKQIDPDRSSPYDPYNDQWLTLRYIFAVHRDVDFRPASENSFPDNNEASANFGYVSFLIEQWKKEIFPDPQNLFPGSTPGDFQFHGPDVAVADGTPLDPAGDGGPWDFKLAEHFLNIFSQAQACPVIIHCHEGMGRTGTAMALIGYAIYGLSMPDAIEAGGGWKIDRWQSNFLYAFAKVHPVPGYLWSVTSSSCVSDHLTER